MAYGNGRQRDFLPTDKRTHRLSKKRWVPSSRNQLLFPRPPRLPFSQSVLLVRIDPDLHALEHLQVVIGQAQRTVFALVRFVVSRMRPQTDLQPQRQLHLVARVTEALDCFGNLRRVLYRFVDRRSYFLDYLFCCVINIQMLIRLCWLERGRPVSLSAATLCYASSALLVNRVLSDDFRFFRL
jgi:hypothetical protein